MTTPTVKLASGYQMPLVGFGLWKVDLNTTADTVYAAIQTGYRLFDGAYDYANEKEAGEGIRRAIKDGLIKREDVFVTTKLWNNYHEKERVAEMGKFQNETWGLGYIDLYVMHFPVALEYIEPSKLQYPAWWMDSERKSVSVIKVPIMETWQAMEKLVDEGIARSLGVSNFSTQLLYDVISYARIPISSLQIEHHPYLVQSQLIAMAQEEGIAVTGYSTFGPQSFLELPEAFRKKAADVPMLLDHDVIKKIATKYEKGPGQVLLRWATQRGVAVIPKSNNKGRLLQNLNVNDFSMTKEELESISALDKGLRFNDPGFYLTDRPIRIFS